MDNSDEEIELPSDILEALEKQDEGSKPNIEELEIINLANEGEEPREVKIGTHCTTEQKEALIALLREFHEIFAWSYQDMPGLDTDIVVHKIPLKPECKPVKQALRRMKPEVILKIKEEVEKQLKAGFLSTVTYSDWVANIVPVPKKDGKVRMCVDYRDLNRASPKDNFPLPHIDTLVDNTATNTVFSFMDGFSGYNQIKMAEEDKSKTAFVTHWGTFVYDVMPFGLKNAGATYQRAMVTLFHDMIHHEKEVYVDDMIAKSRTAQDHLTDLRKLFQRLKKYQLRLNPNKCAFGVTSGKLLGFIVSGRGIEIDPAKVQAIRSMPAPKTEKEIRSFLGRINYIARFIAQLTATCEPLFKSLRKDVKIKWTEDCQRAFGKIKEYLLNPPILVPPTPGRPLILYLTVQEASMGCMLGQQDETGKKERAIYYLSKKFTEPETRYLLVEKTCCALALGLQEAETVHAILHHLVGIPDGSDQAFKGQAIADYLADYPSEQLELMDSEFPDEDVMTIDEDNHGRWKLYFDGAANAVGSGIGAVLVSPKGQQTPIAVKLGFDCTNNMTEYEACIVGLQAALEFGAYELEVYGDSLLIVSQTNGEWQARDPKLIPYQRYISRLVPKFKYVTFTYTPRAHNHFADALATLASLIKLAEGDDVRPLRIETRDIPAYCVCVEECMNVEAEIDNKPWYYDIKRFVQDREYPPRATENEKKYIRKMAFQCRGSQSVDPRDARGTNRSPCQRTLPGPENYESWLLLVDNGEGLHQTCPDVARCMQECNIFTLWPRRAVLMSGNAVITPFLPHGIFSGVGAQNGTARTKPALIRRGLAASNTPKKKVRDTFPKPIWEATFAQRFSPTRCNLVREPRPLGKRFTSATTCNFRIVKSSSGQAGISVKKMTPWHKEHSDGLRSQDHILRTQTRLCARPVPLEKVFLTRNKLICEPGHIGKKTHPCTTWNSRIARIYQEFIGASRNPDRKTALKRTKNTPVASVRGAISHKSKLGFPQIRNLAKSRQRKLSDGTKNVKIRHRELGQICARTGTRFEKKRAGSKTHFFSRTAAFARRVFPARNKLIREPGCVGKIMTPATTWNSRFADSIPRLTGILHRKECTKTAPTPRLPGAITPSSELRFAQTLYRWKEDVESFPTICRMTHFEFRKTSKTAPENRIKKGYAHGNRGGFEELLAWKDKTATWQYHNSRRTVMRRA
uniref:RNase H type-1 domain-containing protein n=1 Tax=Fagus sylvatica TaxID=28930 RepID=A0A2N9HYU6_FAGSY